MLKCNGAGRVVDIKSGTKNDKSWAIARVCWQEYDGRDESGKFKYRDEYASLMMRGTVSERFVKAVKRGKVVLFEGKPRAGTPYTPKSGGDPKSGLEIVIEDYNGSWDFPPREIIEGETGTSKSSDEEEDEPAPRKKKSAPKDDDEDPDELSDPFGNQTFPR